MHCFCASYASFNHSSVQKPKHSCMITIDCCLLFIDHQYQYLLPIASAVCINLFILFFSLKLIISSIITLFEYFITLFESKTSYQIKCTVYTTNVHNKMFNISLNKYMYKRWQSICNTNTMSYSKLLRFSRRCNKAINTKSISIHNFSL